MSRIVHSGRAAQNGLAAALMSEAADELIAVCRAAAGLPDAAAIAAAARPAVETSA